MTPFYRTTIARVLISVVIAWNVQAALAFLIAPGVYAPGFELSGEAGKAAVQGTAVLFLMWNIPYLVAAWQPVKHLLSLKEALVMQALGLLGECGILLTLAGEHAALRGSLLRFIAFDGAGLVLLGAALWLVTARE